MRLAFQVKARAFRCAAGHSAGAGTSGDAAAPNMKPFSTLAALPLLLSTAASPALATCVGQVLLPPTESVHGQRVLEAPGRVERFRVPAQVETLSHRVQVRAARTERVRYGAQYRVERRVVEARGPTRWSRTADRYETVAQPVVIAPGHWVWERRFAPVVSAPPQPGQTVVSPTGVIMCRVWCPPRYAMVPRQVLAERGHRVAEPTTVSRVLERRVLVHPAGWSVRVIPAQYRIVTERRMAAPARWVMRRTPARWGWREMHETHDGGSAWAPVVCGGPLSRPAMARMQSSLAAQGYDPGPADGIGRPETYTALHRFQVEHRLAAGQVTVESARALGVIPPQ
jgi:hypothetical protein